MLFTVRCGALTHIPLTFELEYYDNAPHRTANDAEYELTFTGNTDDGYKRFWDSLACINVHTIPSLVSSAD